MRTIMLKEPDKRFGLKAGKKYRAKPYPLDPVSKMTITIGGKEICTQYRHNIIFCDTLPHVHDVYCPDLIP
jgi:hypothetical protein